MNGYERYLGMVRGEPVDILPRLPILMGWAAHYIGSDYAAFASDYRVLVEANLRCARDFGFDQVSAISDPFRETSAFGAQLRYLPDGPPRCLTLPLGDSKDLSRLGSPDPRRSPRMLDRLRAVEHLRDAVAGQLSILGWIEGPAAEAADLRGVTTFLLDLVDDPEFCRELMHRCVDVGLDFALAQLEAGADTIGIGDAIVSQVSPAMYQRLILPEEQRLADGIHAAGGLVRLHICGNISRHLDRIRQLGADLVDLDWMVDMSRARELLGEDTTLVGNLDPVRAVLDSNPAAIGEAIDAIYARVGNRYAAGAGCEVPLGTHPDNLRALCRAVPYLAARSGPSADARP